MINEIKKIITVISILLMICLPVAASVNEEVEIRGEIANGDIIYDYTNFAGFWYDLDTNRFSETMNITIVNRTIDEGSLIYTCKAVVIPYENPTLTNYTIIGFFSEKFLCYDDRVDKLVKLLVEWKSSDSKILEMDESINFPEGYSLLVREIDLEGSKSILDLYKDSERIDTEIIVSGGIYRYYDSDDVLVFSCEVNSVFRGTDSNLVVIKYVFLRSENIIDIDTGDSFGVMKVKSVTGNTIILYVLNILFFDFKAFITGASFITSGLVPRSTTIFFIYCFLPPSIYINNTLLPYLFPYIHTHPRL